MLDCGEFPRFYEKSGLKSCVGGKIFPTNSHTNFPQCVFWLYGSFKKSCVKKKFQNILVIIFFFHKMLHSIDAVVSMWEKVGKPPRLRNEFRLFLWNIYGEAR